MQSDEPSEHKMATNPGNTKLRQTQRTQNGDEPSEHKSRSRRTGRRTQNGDEPSEHTMATKPSERKMATNPANTKWQRTQSFLLICFDLWSRFVFAGFVAILCSLGLSPFCVRWVRRHFMSRFVFAGFVAILCSLGSSPFCVRWARHHFVFAGFVAVSCSLQQIILHWYTYMSTYIHTRYIFQTYVHTYLHGSCVRIDMLACSELQGFR
jgi:hypothetical protein